MFYRVYKITYIGSGYRHAQDTLLHKYYRPNFTPVVLVRSHKLVDKIEKKPNTHRLKYMILSLKDTLLSRIYTYAAAWDVIVRMGCIT